MVFHPADDFGVQYVGNRVVVDGQEVVISVYGTNIVATREFKYLGVHLNSQGDSERHGSARLDALHQAINMLRRGLINIPGFCFRFMSYLWHTLVAPVGLYGCEVFVYSASTSDGFDSLEISCWRKLLGVGGRAPCDSLFCLRGFEPLSVEFRVRRAAFFIKLANSPTASWQQAALTYHCMFQSRWFQETFDIIRRSLPGLRVRATLSLHGYCIDSMGSWSDCERWQSLLAYGFPRDASG
eukprot:4355777-Karenia_brevis.AAC.1